MTVKTITIQGLDFEAPQPYAAGHQITEAEAKALNQVLAENLRNNFAPKIKAEKGEADELTAEQKQKLEAAFAEYAAGYEFTLASVGGGKRETDPIQLEANKIARALVSEKIRSSGRKLKDVDPDKLAEAVAKVASTEAVLKSAKKIVADRQKTAESALADFDL